MMVNTEGPRATGEKKTKPKPLLDPTVVAYIYVDPLWLILAVLENEKKWIKEHGFGLLHRRCQVARSKITTGNITLGTVKYQQQHEAVTWMHDYMTAGGNDQQGLSGLGDFSITNLILVHAEAA